MKRKIIQQGPATLMISLPAKWVKKYGLKKGEEIELSEEGKELIISTGSETKEETEIVVEIKSVEKFMGRLLHTPYRFGYNKVSINYSDPSVVPKIQQFLDQLLGFEIIEQSANNMKIEMVAKELENEFEKMLRRTFTIISEMTKETVNGIKKNNKDKLNDVISMESTVNKLTNFCERLLNKYGYSDHKKTNFMYCTVWTIEQIGDEIRDICKASLETKNFSNELISALEFFSNNIEDFITLFYKHNYDEIWAFRQKNRELIEKIGEIKAKEKKEYLIIALMKSSASKINHLTLSLL